MEFGDRLNRLKERGFTVQKADSGRTRVSKYGCAAILEDRGDEIPGVGKVRAERLVARFGLEAIKKVIARDPEAVKIVGKKTIEGADDGFTLAWFRTPYGARCERVDTMLAARGLTHFNWDLDPQEWRHDNAKKAYEYVTKQLGKMTGRDVLLMHDIKKATVIALPQILDWIDQENAARTLAHKRRIRIIQSYQLAEERLPAGELDWLHDVTPDPLVWGRALASVLP